MKKVIFILIALSVALVIINPDIDIYAYFVNLLENFPDFKSILGYTMDILRDFADSASLLGDNFSWTQLGETILTFLHFIFDFLIVAPVRLIVWLIQFIKIVFGGLI